MPVDTTRVISTRRSQKQISEEELKDIELKRMKGELSCAECRRLKLKCDKQVPCGSCVRRGCDSICPCGILSAGQGTRFILADTDQLHRKISEMSTRIRQLEDALAILQASVSEERHPLLSDEHLKLKFGGEALEHKPEPPTPSGTKDVIDALGTLALGEDGNATYFGRSAGSETLMLAEDGDDGESEDHDAISLPPEIEQLSNRLPLFSTRRPNARALELLEAFLPDRARATALCEVWINHAAFFFRPIKQEELLHTLLPQIYETAQARVHARANGEPPAHPLEIDDSAYPHSLASLFLIFSLGALMDVSLPPYNAQGEHFYHLGRAALSLRNTYSPTLETVQAVGLMATYHSLAGKKYTRHGAWCIMGVAAKLAQSYGLHRDSARWNLDPALVQRRRNLFWEIFSADVSHSLALGRPPALQLSYVDCEYPEDKEATLSDTGEIQSGFWKLKHDYARDIFYCVAEATLTAQAPNYQTILDLDRKVREMSFPTSLKPYLSPADGESLYYSTSLSVRDFYASQYRTVTMLYLHRSFFAQAMLDFPTNPMKSPFSASFLTAARCASIIIKATAHQFDRCETLAKRIWFLLYHTFSAAIIVGTIVTRCPNSSIAANALSDLQMAVFLFQRAAPQSQRARVALAVLKRLQDKASEIYKDSTSGEPPTSPQVDNDSEAARDIDLAIFGGQARVLTTKGRRKPSISQRRNSIGSPTRTTGNDSAWTSVSPPQSSALPSSASSPPSHPSPDDFDIASQFSNFPNLNSNAAPSVESAYLTGGPTYSQLFASLGSSTSEYMATQSQAHQPTATDQPNAWAWATWDPMSQPPWLPSTSQGQTTGDWSAAMRQPSAPDMSYPAASGSRYQGSDGMGSSQHDAGPAYQFDLQENVELLSSFGLVSQNLKDQQSRGGLANQGGDSNLGGAMPLNPGAIELGLSGESRLDSNWLAFMQDCGILGSDVPMS
ncbi:fungal-specific transcription factor domain-containing protein [Ephemerocybe angulata]|uniref:Fungal-specific transcription factor domain-containing protein n=1 Tax=Ephemerocybe angulata TaxID=980116 RepID=A0A8H6IAL3_9AGAR|nr:fungal-specific transcription factor domain-containing protein [Tulosesus angulatus]